MRDGLPCLKITDLIESSGLVEFWRKATKKNKYLVEEVEMLPNTVNDEKAS